MTPLTARERSILQRAALGDTAKEMAHQDSRSLRSVQLALERARAKLGARNTAHAVHLAYAAGEISRLGCGHLETYWWHYRRGDVIDPECMKARAEDQRRRRRSRRKAQS